MINNRKFIELSKLGAGDFEHLSGSLEKHLTATCDLLSQWEASDELRDAGLYHAAYGMAGFETAMVNTDQRAKISEIIGEHAERIVYVYCACDRTFVWPLLDGSYSVKFRDRFAVETGFLEGRDLRYFCELTIANEVACPRSKRGPAPHQNKRAQARHGRRCPQTCCHPSPHVG